MRSAATTLHALARTALARLILRLRTRTLLPFKTGAEVLNRYVGTAPSLQNAIDSVPGWTGAMPFETGLRAGTSALYADNRIDWLLRTCFDITGRTALELGPLEGFHTYMLERAGAAAIDAIEANALAFVRCLITKEALKLTRASFYLGDFMRWLDEPPRRYDLVVASGVLYHSDDPVRLLERIGDAADAVFLWTHVFDEVAMPPGDKRRLPFSEAVEIRRSHGVAVRLYERSYYRSWRDPSFCGGLQDRHFWMNRADLLTLLAAMGFNRLLIADDQPDHIYGPSFSVFGQRVPQTGGATGEGAAPDAAIDPSGATGRDISDTAGSALKDQARPG